SLDYARSGLCAPFVDGRTLELPPTVDTTRFFPAVAPAEKIILQVGGLDRAHYFKGVRVLIDAMARLRDVPCHAVVVADGHMRAEYEAAARAAGVADRVTFAGRVDDADLPALEQQASAFAFPSTDKSEAFGIAALEAMASGVPVVASALPGVRTIVRPH